MKAVVYTAYGSPDVLQLKEVEKPIPGDDEVLVSVHAASVNYGDWSFVRGKPLLVRLMGAGLLKPKNTILGADVAGQVEAVGSKVQRFHPGDVEFAGSSPAKAIGSDEEGYPNDHP
jgi:NADPH:quinone reductase-like Zn-dependent oxidoreductase